MNYPYLLILADSPMILGHRLSELCGHGPTLETDIALTNIALDLFGQVRNYCQYAAEVHGNGKTEDEVAFLRYEHEYRNVLLTEQPNHDFAWVIGRQYLFDAFHLPLLGQLAESKDTRLAGIAMKSLKEVRYHHRFSSEWIKRLGGGTEESHNRMQSAMDQLYSYVEELFLETPDEKAMKEAGIGADYAKIRPVYDEDVRAVFYEAGLAIPEGPWHRTIGKNGVHSEHLGYILTELQYMQRTYPGMEW